MPRRWCRVSRVCHYVLASSRRIAQCAAATESEAPKPWWPSLTRPEAITVVIHTTVVSTSSSEALPLLVTVGRCAAPPSLVSGCLGQFTDVATHRQTRFRRSGTQPGPSLIVHIDTKEPSSGHRVTLARRTPTTRGWATRHLPRGELLHLDSDQFAEPPHQPHPALNGFPLQQRPGLVVDLNPHRPSTPRPIRAHHPPFRPTTLTLHTLLERPDPPLRQHALATQLRLLPIQRMAPLEQLPEQSQHLALLLHPSLDAHQQPLLGRHRLSPATRD